MKSKILILAITFFVTVISAQQKGTTPLSTNNYQLKTLSLLSLASPTTRIQPFPTYALQIKMQKHLQIIFDQLRVVHWMQII